MTKEVTLNLDYDDIDDITVENLIEHLNYLENFSEDPNEQIYSKLKDIEAVYRVISMFMTHHQFKDFTAGRKCRGIQ